MRYKNKISIIALLLCMIVVIAVAENVNNGTSSLGSVTTGDDNVATGSYSLQSLTTGHGNTGLGAYAGRSSLTVNGGVYLGYGAGISNTSAHKLYIQTMFYPTLGIFGDFSTGYFGINNSSPAVALDVTGAITSSGTITGVAITGTGTITFSDRVVMSDTLFVSKEQTVIGADSSFYATVASGNPFLGLRATDGDLTNITVNTSDQLLFQGASGGYSFDAEGAFGTTTPVANTVTIGDTNSSGLLVTMEQTPAGTDSSIVIKEVSGVPVIDFYGTDGDTYRITINTSDAAVFSGAGGGYQYDDVMQTTKDWNGNTYVTASNSDSTNTAATANVKASAQWGGVSIIAHGKGRTSTRYGHAIGNWGTIETDVTDINLGHLGMIIGTRTAKPIIFGINDSFAAVIDSVENVGIGSEVPTAKLTIRGIIGGNDSLLVLRDSLGKTHAYVDTTGIAYADTSRQVNSVTTGYKIVNGAIIGRSGATVTGIATADTINTTNSVATGYSIVNGAMIGRAGLDLVGTNLTGAKQPVEIIDAANVLTASETGLLSVYRPLTAKRTATLPAAAAGLLFDFMVADTDSLLITVAADDSLITSAGAAWVTTSSVAGTIRLVAIDAVRWVMMQTSGTWTSY